jgi:hypothetical protein
MEPPANFPPNLVDSGGSWMPLEVVLLLMVWVCERMSDPAFFAALLTTCSTSTAVWLSR